MTMSDRICLMNGGRSSNLARRSSCTSTRARCSSPTSSANRTCSWRGDRGHGCRMWRSTEGGRSERASVRDAASGRQAGPRHGAPAEPHGWIASSRLDEVRGRVLDSHGQRQPDQAVCRTWGRPCADRGCVPDAPQRATAVRAIGDVAMHWEASDAVALPESSMSVHGCSRLRRRQHGVPRGGEFSMGAPLVLLLVVLLVYPVGQLLLLSVYATARFTLTPYRQLFASSVYVDVLLITLKISLWTTLLPSVARLPRGVLSSLRRRRIAGDVALLGASRVLDQLSGARLRVDRDCWAATASSTSCSLRWDLRTRPPTCFTTLARCW